ncbi:MAG TPA: metallophosphoesterase family protein [Minicystis sp.]|nr:metallophosphoesterase family protein [Minicystis sp.]
MPGRTFAIGDIHGDLDALEKVLGKLPALGEADTVVFVGDYLDRGPKPKAVVDFVRSYPSRTKAKVVALRGNHEDAWLRVVDRGWPEFTLPAANGCLTTLRSYAGGAPPAEGDVTRDEEMGPLLSGSFFPEDVVAWMRQLPFWYEDDHAIYVHAGLPQGKSGFMHPAEVRAPVALLWCRDEAFFRHYRGKLVVFGHTATEYLPPELSSYTPEDPTDLWAGPCTVGLDTGCGKGGFLTALELPAMRVYESR